MKILFVQNAQGIGGSENYMLHLLPALRERGHEVAFAGVHNTRARGKRDEVSRWMDSFRALDIPVFYRETGSYLSPAILPWLWNCYRSGAQGGRPFDLMHTHLIYADFWAACLRATRGPQCAAVSTVHGYEERILERYVLEPEKVPRNLYWQVFNHTRRYLTYTYACSYGLRDFCTRAGIRGAAQWGVVEHGFDFVEALPSPDPACRLGSPQLAVIGRLIRRKGVPLALEALRRLVPEFPGIRMVLVGSGPEESALRALASQLGVQDHVHFQGFDPQPQRWMLASDLVLVPSYAEGLPLVLMEAFHARKPAVAFNTIGCRDMIEHEQTGLLAEAFDPEALAVQLRRVLAEPALAQRLQTQAHERLHQHFNLKRMVDETLKAYEHTLAIQAGRKP